MMEMESFINMCKEAIIRDLDIKKVYQKNIFVVWSCKTLQNKKALLGTDDSDYYYEFTYDGNKERIYMDKYEKVDNQTIQLF